MLNLLGGDAACKNNDAKNGGRGEEIEGGAVDFDEAHRGVPVLKGPAPGLEWGPRVVAGRDDAHGNMGWSGVAGAGHEDGVEGDVGEEAEFEAEGDDLVGVGGEGEVLAAGAEVGEGGVGGAGEFEAEGDEGSVEVEDGTELDFEAEVHGGGGEGAAFEDPAAALGEGGGELGEEREAVGVAVAEELEDLEGRGGERGGNGDGIEVREVHGWGPAFEVADC